MEYLEQYKFSMFNHKVFKDGKLFLYNAYSGGFCMCDDIMKKTFKVNGMMCEHCKANVEKALSSIPNITEINIDLESKNVTVSSESEINNEKI